MKPQALLLIMLGLLFGPGYFGFAEYLSGRAGQTYTLTERANRWPLPDGSILRIRGGLAYKPIPLDLTPADNGYRMRFVFDVSRASLADTSNSYQVSLLQGEIPVVERNVTVQGSDKVKVSLDPVQILYPGAYLLLLEEIGTPPLAVSGVTLQIDTHVEQPHMWIAWSGMVMLVFGVGLQLREMFVRMRKA